MRVRRWEVSITVKSRWWGRHQIELQRRTKQPRAWRSRWRAEAETAQGKIRNTNSQQKKWEHMCVGRWDIVYSYTRRIVTMSSEELLDKWVLQLFLKGKILEVEIELLDENSSFVGRFFPLIGFRCTEQRMGPRCVVAGYPSVGAGAKSAFGTNLHLEQICVGNKSAFGGRP